MERHKTPAQVLFDRLVRNHIMPVLRERARRGAPVPFRVALLIWEEPTKPTLFLNEEAYGKVITTQVVATGPISAGQAVMSSDIKGITGVGLHTTWGQHPFIFIVQGAADKYFLTSKAMGQIRGYAEFDVLRDALSTEGMIVSAQDTTLTVFLDLVRNQYGRLSPGGKRGETKRLAHFRREAARRDATARVRRHLRLPTLIVHADDEFLPLLRETREAYIDGHYFSSIAAAVTTTDRVCNWLVQRYTWRPAQQRQFFGYTFGKKIEPLRARGLITPEQESVLRRMNRLRTKHLHPSTTTSPLTLKRDALAMIRHLHEYLEGTVGVFRDYQIDEDGKLVPKPIASD